MRLLAARRRRPHGPTTHPTVLAGGDLLQPDPHTHHQCLDGVQGATAVEAVGLVVAIAVLLAAALPTLRASGRSPAAAVSTRLEAVRGVPLGHSTGSGRVVQPLGHFAWGSRVAAPAVRVEIPAQHGWLVAWHRFTGAWHRDLGPTHTTTTVSACFVCAGASGQGGVAPGASIGAGSRGSSNVTPNTAGVMATLTGRAFVAVAQATATSTTALDYHSLHALSRTSLDAVVGADATGTARLSLSHQSQRLDLGGSAVAGGKVRAEQRAAVSIAGLGLDVTAGAEGWAGAGASGGVHLGHHDGHFDFGMRTGAALGLGGAYDLQTSIDLSGLGLWGDQ